MTVKPFSRLNYNARNYNVVSAVMVPVYGVTASSSSINEGTAVTYTITTQYVLDGTILYWTTSGTTVAADFSDGVTSGSVTMTNGTATVVRTLLADILTEGAETIVFELRTVSTSGTIVASTPSGTVNDVSVLTITPSTSSVNEGSSVTWTINAIGFGTGTLYYTNSGTTTGPDFSDGLNSGSIAITADAGTLTKTLLNDLSTEGSETIIIQIRTGSTSGTVVGTSNTVTVADTSYSSQAYSVKFNGSSNLNITNNSALDFGTGDFTVEFWMYAISFPNAAGIVGKKANDTTNGWQIFYSQFNGTNKMSMRLTQTTDVTSTSSWILNVWEHWAVTRSGTTVRWFKNGMLDATGTSSANLTDSAALNIGWSDTWSTYFTGYLSNVRIVKGTAIYTANFNPPTDQLSAISGTSLLTCKNATISDSSSNAFSITNGGTPIVTMENPFGDYSMSFNGSSQYISASSFNANIGTNNFTAEGWFYFTTVTSAGCLFYSGNGGGSTAKIYLFVNATGGLGTSITLSGGVENITTANNIVLVNTWYHIALVRNSSILTIYVNGVSVGTTTNSINLTGITNGFYIGYATGGDANGYFKGGYISNFRFVSGTALYPWIPATTALTTTSQNATASQVSLLTAQSATIVDNGNGGPGRPTYIATSTYGVGINATSQNLNTSSSNAFAFGTGDFTVEFWAYWISNPGVTGNLMHTNVSGTGFCMYWNSTQVQISRYLTAADLNITYSETAQNTWVHYAAVRRSGTMYVYRNGVLLGSGAVSTSYTQNGFYLFSDNTNTTFNGYITNVRVVKGLGVYTGTFTPSGPLTATQSAGTNIAAITGTSTSLLTLQDATFVDNSTNAFTITATGSPTISNLVNFPITNTGTVTAGNSVIPFASTYSYQFNGSSQYLTIPANSAFAFGTGDFTVECWIYPISFNSYNGIIDLRDSNPGVCVVYWSNGTLEFGTSGSVYLQSASGVILSGRWTHIACVRYSGFKYIYVNGAQVARTADSQNNTSTSGLVYIGRTNDGYYVNGYISNLRMVKGSALYSSNFVPTTSALTAITNTSLLTCQYAELYDASTNKLAITNTGSTPASPQNPFGNYYASFNGSSQYLSTPYNSAWSIPAGGAFCMEAWVYMTSQGGFYSILSMNWNAGSSVSSWGFAIDNNFPQLPIPGSGQGSTYYMLSRTSSNTFPLNTWTHVAITRDSTGAVRSFINGLMNGYYFTALTTGSGQGMTAASGTLYVATTTNQYAGSYFPGYLSNVRFVNGSVPSAYATSATTLGTQAFAVPTTPLTAVTNTKLLTCQYADIVDSSTNVFPITNTGTVKTYLTDTFSGIVSGVNYAQKNYSLKLNTTSTNQYVDTYHASNFAFGTGDFTIESWIYLDNSFKSLSLESVGVVAWFGDNGGNPSGLFAQMGSDRLSISRPGYATNVYLRYPGATTGTPYLQYNTWYHLAITRQSATWKIFLNGVQGTTDSATDYSINTTSVRFGGSPTTSFAFPGYISNLRVVKGVAVYTGTFTPSTTPLKAAQSSGTNIAAITTQTSLLTCQYNTLFDASNNKLALTRTGAPDMAPVYPFPT